MPRYVYRCRSCDESFERVRSIEEHSSRTPRCPRCDGEEVERVLTPFFAKTSSKT